MAPLQLETPSRDLETLAGGIVDDLSVLMNRLGDVTVTPLPSEAIRDAVRTARGSRGTGTPPAQWNPLLVPSLDAAAVDRLLSGQDGDYIVTGTIERTPAGVDISVTLRGAGGERRWSAREEFVDDEVHDSRVLLAANLVEAATGRRKHVRGVRPGGPFRVEAWLSACSARFRRTDPETRVDLLRRAVELDAAYAEARVMLADALDRIGAREASLEVLAAAAEQFPDVPAVRQRYGMALRLAGYPREAVAEVQSALDADPDGLTLFHAGLFAESGGDIGTAQLLYERAAERGCVHAVLYDKLGTARANAGRHADAMELWERARTLDSAFSHLLGNLALAVHHLGDDERAESLFRDALIVAPHNFSTHANHAIFLQDLGRHADAIHACTRALAIKADSALLHNNRGVSRLAIGDEEGARIDFEAALQAQPHAELETYVRANLARLERGQTRRDEALRLLQHGAALVRQEQPRAAIPLLLEALDLTQDAPECWLFLGLAYRDERDWDGVAEALGHVLRLAPDNAEVASERALALLALGRHHEAVDHARLGVKLSPRDSALVCNLGLVLMESGELEEARDQFAEAARLDPSDAIVGRCVRELRRRVRRDPGWGSDWQVG
jgi:tetratricopeptide (TPR) repeat protein